VSKDAVLVLGLVLIAAAEGDGLAERVDDEKADFDAEPLSRRVDCELPAVSLDTVLSREAGGQTGWKVMERR
jgi:hypothetical protein